MVGLSLCSGDLCVLRVSVVVSVCSALVDGCGDDPRDLLSDSSPQLD